MGIILYVDFRFITVYILEKIQENVKFNYNLVLNYVITLHLKNIYDV